MGSKKNILNNLEEMLLSEEFTYVNVHIYSDQYKIDFTTRPISIAVEENELLISGDVDLSFSLKNEGTYQIVEEDENKSFQYTLDKAGSQLEIFLDFI